MDRESVYHLPLLCFGNDMYDSEQTFYGFDGVLTHLIVPVVLKLRLPSERKYNPISLYSADPTARSTTLMMTICLRNGSVTCSAQCFVDVLSCLPAIAPHLRRWVAVT